MAAFGWPTWNGTAATPTQSSCAAEARKAPGAGPSCCVMATGTTTCPPSWLCQAEQWPFGPAATTAPSNSMEPVSATTRTWARSRPLPSPLTRTSMSAPPPARMATSPSPGSHSAPCSPMSTPDVGPPLAGDPRFEYHHQMPVTGNHRSRWILRAGRGSLGTAITPATTTCSSRLSTARAQASRSLSLPIRGPSSIPASRWTQQIGLGSLSTLPARTGARTTPNPAQLREAKDCTGAGDWGFGCSPMAGSSSRCRRSPTS